jgi:threonylcarbamoyladenosine tRNA methylthiotransferase MtaB
VKSVVLHTLGCKLNYSETSTLAGKFFEKGFKIKPFGEQSDVFVLNTCSVTENADRECRQIIRSVLTKKPDTYVAVTGCYAQLQPQEIARIYGVDVVLGTREKFKLLDYLDNLEKKDYSCVFRSPIEESTEFDYAYSSDIDSRTRAFLKIQDGCDYKCSFCTIPQARGKSRSLPVEKVIENAKQLIDGGYKEIVLTGVNVGDYNYELGIRNYKLIDVLYELDKLPVPRIRISSIEPNLVNDKIIQLVKSSEKFCRHFHIPMQSGDNEILKLMRRRYCREDYQELISKVKDEMPDFGIGADVIVGFPGETDDRFENTKAFIESLPLSYLHVFSYSERRNTYAATLPGSVEIVERKRRSKILRELSVKKRSKFYSENCGTVREVLFESVRENGYTYGLTDNYVKVRGKGQAENELARVELVPGDGENYCLAS